MLKNSLVLILSLSTLVGVTIGSMLAKAPDDAIVSPFSTLVGNVKVGPVNNNGPTVLPYITWGGDVATFLGNGGLNTTPDSTFGKMGLNFKLESGDNFVEQVKNYISGKTPFLRGTTTMIAQASELLNQNPATKPVMLFQMTWSAGDHAVARNMKNLGDFKTRRIKVCLQQGGPHIGLMNDILQTASVKWSDVEVVWANELTGPQSPAELFRKDPSIDVCCVISPDMVGLTGGLDSKGTGAETTVKGAFVLVSTAQMSRSIADVYVARSDWYNTHISEAKKFTAGYLRACEDLVALKKTYNDGKGKSPEYIALLKLTQQIYTEKVIPTIEVDAHGLVVDASFVGLAGNISFFTDKGNLNGFEAKQKVALDMAVALGYAKTRAGYDYARWDYHEIAKIGGVVYNAPVASSNRIQGEGINLFPDSNLDDKTLYSFTIQFEPNQESFSIDTYGAEFQRVAQMTSTFGNCAVVVRGHSDPTKTLVDFVKAGLASGVLKRSGDPTSGYTYYFSGKQIDLNSTKDILKLIQSGEFRGENNPQETMQAALNLSLVRAEAVKKALLNYAQVNKINIDPSQIQPSGVGIREPLIAKPANIEQARKNMRVEFRLIKVSPENIKPSDFDY